MTFFALGREAKSQEAETETTGRKPMVCPLCGDRYEGTYIAHADSSDRHRRAIRIIADTHERAGCDTQPDTTTADDGWTEAEKREAWGK